METNAPNYLNFTLTTPRLILKKADASDLPDIYHNLWRHAESARYMLWEATRSTAEAEDRLRRSIAFQKEHKYAFFVREKATGKTIGFAGMKEVAPGVFFVILCLPARQTAKFPASPMRRKQKT